MINSRKADRLLRSPKVEEVENGGMADNEWMVHLVPGWAFRDAAKRPEDDPNGSNAQHSRGGTVKELLGEARQAERCRCGRCEVAA